MITGRIQVDMSGASGYDRRHVFPVPAAHCLDDMVDEVLVAVFQHHNERNEARTVAPRWRDIVNQCFQFQRFDPPMARTFNVDFEIDRDMTKHIYTAQFRSPSQDGAFLGQVTFLNWAPSFLRSVVHNKSIIHSLNEADSCLMWRLVTKIVASRTNDTVAESGPGLGHLAFTQGTPDSEAGEVRSTVGRLSLAQTKEVLDILDHRRNKGAIAVMTEAQSPNEDYLIKRSA